MQLCIQLADALLCHDDELEGRRIAFILYLVPPWDSSLGGTLDLYNVDEHFQPKQIVKSLIPSWNTLVFFEVSPVSFHQVSEVLSEEKSRLSISGWFHGPSLTRPPAYFEPPIPRSPHIPRDVRISACCRILILAAVAYQVFLWFQEWLFLIMKPDLELALPLCLDKLAGVLLGQFPSTLYLTRRQF